MEGIAHPNDGGGLRFGEGTQTDAVGQVGVEPAELSGLDPLARQQQVDADGTSDSSDRQQEIDQVRTGGQKLAELVDEAKMEALFDVSPVLGNCPLEIRGADPRLFPLLARR